MLNVIPLDYDAPQNLIVVVDTYGKFKGKVRYGWVGKVRLGEVR